MPDAERKAAAEAEKLKGNDHLRAGKLEEFEAWLTAAVDELEVHQEKMRVRRRTMRERRRR